MALAQSIYLVGGRPALAAAYLVARAQQIGAIKGAPRYRTEGTWPDISVTATVCTPDGEKHEATVSMQEAREDGWAARNPKSKTHRPAENMLVNRAGARLIRRVAPGVVLGMAIAEEAMDVPPAEAAEVEVRPARPSAAPRKSPLAIEQREAVDVVAEVVRTEERAKVPVEAAAEGDPGAGSGEGAPNGEEW
jgi:hypothetical protein